MYAFSFGRPQSDGSLDFPCSYHGDLFYDPLTVADQCIKELTLIDQGESQFDTLVGTGLSGSVILSLVASMMDKKFLVVRKKTERSHHIPGGLVGSLGSRWVFFDDFISIGNTIRTVQMAVHENALDSKFETKFVGAYLYACDPQQRWRWPHQTPRFSPSIINHKDD